MVCRAVWTLSFFGSALYAPASSAPVGSAIMRTCPHSRSTGLSEYPWSSSSRTGCYTAMCGFTCFAGRFHWGPSMLVVGIMHGLRWARGKLNSSDFAGLAEDPEPCHFMQWLSCKGNAWRHVLRRLWHCTAGEGAAQDLPFSEASAGSSEACRLCGFTCATKHSLASHLAIKHHLKQKIHFLIRGTVCPACSMDFHTRTRVLKHLSRSSPACRIFVHKHSRHCSMTEQDQLAEAERRRLRASRGRGRLDRLPAQAGVIEPVTVGTARTRSCCFILMTSFDFSVYLFHACSTVSGRRAHVLSPLISLRMFL